MIISSRRQELKLNNILQYILIINRNNDTDCNNGEGCSNNSNNHLAKNNVGSKEILTIRNISKKNENIISVMIILILMKGSG